MKTSNSLVIISLAVFFCSTNISCKKLFGEDEKKCHITSITTNNGTETTVFTVTYNNDGKISTLSEVRTGFTQNKVFNYSGNTVLINTTDGSGSLIQFDSITVDNRGRPINIREYDDATHATWRNNVLEYNGDDMSRLIATSESSATPQISITIYNNGNMVSLQSPNGNITLEYYTNEKVQPGDYLEVSTLIQYGMTIYPHKNLVKTLATGSTIFNFNYEKNSDGYITKITATSGTSVSTVTYQYACN